MLIVAAAYHVASHYLGKQVLPLKAHNAADQQTGSPGDLEITLRDDNQVITAYEMKTRRVSREDIDRAMQKLADFGQAVEHYIFITTEPIEEQTIRHAARLYETTQGVEVVILDCLSFLRHFLHLFHRLRMQFLDEYQRLVLAEPESAVSQPLKEAFLALRQAAQSE